MKKTFIALAGLVLIASLGGCNMPSGPQSPLPTLVMVPSPTAYVATNNFVVPTATIPTPTMNLPTLTPFPSPVILPTSTAPIPTLVSTPTRDTSIIPGTPTGPYAVIQIAPGDVLSVRTGAGTGYPVAGSFPLTATNVMRTGPSTMSGGDLWVQVQNPGGGTGWVNSQYLTEYMASSNFCSDSRVNTLLTNFGTAFSTSNGELLSALVSPAHGLTVYLWRNGIPHTFQASDARWVFESTYQHDWGSAPASGLDTRGSFHDKVVPWLQEVFSASPTLTCNSFGNAARFDVNPWPLEYANVNFYTVLKPGTPGVDTDFRYWLVGVEYFQGQPFVFAIIHFAWEP